MLARMRADDFVLFVGGARGGVDSVAVQLASLYGARVLVAVRDVADADFVGISIMPEGLLEALPPGEVSDLFAHLKSLTAKAP
jgi:hypothetical protein